MSSISITQALLFGALCVLLKFATQQVLAIKRTLNDLGDCPGRGALFVYPFAGVSQLLDFWFPFKWNFHDYHARFSLFSQFGSTCLSSFMIWGAEPVYWLADAEAIKSVCTERAIYEKDVATYEGVLDFYGGNLLSREGAEWKKHRVVARPAFNEANNAYVWGETDRIVREWTSTIDNGASEITVDLMRDLTKVTMFVIASAAFGRRIAWVDEPFKGAYMQTDSRRSFGETLVSCTNLMLLKSVVPEWLIDMAEKIQIPVIGSTIKDIRKSFDDLKEYMLESVSLARTRVLSEEKGGAGSLDAALLRNMVESNMTEDDLGASKRLTDDEILSNSFIFLVAGHETSSHSLCFLLTLLAIYPDVQRKIYKEITEICSDGAPLAYKDHMSKLIYTNAVFYETLRLYTVIPRAARVAARDTVLEAHKFKSTANGDIRDAEKFTVHIKQGSSIIIDIAATHLNPIHWGNDVHDFRPERFIDTEHYRWPRDAFLAFFSGHHSCIGQRFATIESICLIANIVRNYEILVPANLRDKPLEEQEKLLDWKVWLTARPSNAHVSFRRRRSNIV